MALWTIRYSAIFRHFGDTDILSKSLVRVSLHISYRLHESQCTTLILESDYGPLRNESLVRVSLHRFHRFHSTLVLKSDYGKANRLTSIGTSCFFSHQILRHVRYVHSRIGLWPPPKWEPLVRVSLHRLHGLYGTLIFITDSGGTDPW